MHKKDNTPERSNVNTKMVSGERIAKIIANSGFCSRRDAEKLILEGRVKVNGEKISTPATLITNQKITIDDKPIEKPKKARLFIYYKPVGLVTTHKDEQGRRTVFESLPKHLPRVVSVGRLDLNSEGLLLLTTSGELARKFELPSNNYSRTYRVRVFGKVQINELLRLRKGIRIDGVNYGKVEIEIESLGPNSWLEMTIFEGKNREIRKILKYFDLEVNRLIRVSYGPYNLGELKPGEVREVECE